MTRPAWRHAKLLLLLQWTDFRRKQSNFVNEKCGCWNMTYWKILLFWKFNFLKRISHWKNLKYIFFRNQFFLNQICFKKSFFLKINIFLKKNLNFSKYKIFQKKIFLKSRILRKVKFFKMSYSNNHIFHLQNCFVYGESRFTVAAAAAVSVASCRSRH